MRSSIGRIRSRRSCVTPRAAGVRAPDVSVMLAYERLAPAHLDGVVVSHEILPSGTAVADVTLFVQERGDELAVGIEYAGATVSSADAQRILDTFGDLLERATASPGVPGRGADASRRRRGGPRRTPRAPLGPDRAPRLRRLVRACTRRDRGRGFGRPSSRRTTSCSHGRWSPPTECPHRVAWSACASGGPRTWSSRCSPCNWPGAAYVPLDPASPEDRLRSILGSVELSAVLSDDANRRRFEHPVPIAPGTTLGSTEAVAAGPRPPPPARRARPCLCHLHVGVDRSPAWRRGDPREPRPSARRRGGSPTTNRRSASCSRRASASTARSSGVLAARLRRHDRAAGRRRRPRRRPARRRHRAPRCHPPADGAESVPCPDDPGRRPAGLPAHVDRGGGGVPARRCDAAPHGAADDAAVRRVRPDRGDRLGECARGHRRRPRCRSRSASRSPG